MNALFFFLAACCLMLSSCMLDTHTRLADYGREYECVQTNGRRWHVRQPVIPGVPKDLYVKGRVVSCSRKTDWVQSAMSTTPEATYELISDVREEQPLLTYRLDMWSGTAVPAELSDAALLQEFEDDPVLHPTGEYRTTLHAAWAYPLSAASFAVVDIPCGLVSGLLFVLSTPFAEMGVYPFTEWLK